MHKAGRVLHAMPILRRHVGRSDEDQQRREVVQDFLNRQVLGRPRKFFNSVKGLGHLRPLLLSSLVNYWRDKAREYERGTRRVPETLPPGYQGRQVEENEPHEWQMLLKRQKENWSAYGPLALQACGGGRSQVHYVGVRLIEFRADLLSRLLGVYLDGIVGCDPPGPDILEQIVDDFEQATPWPEGVAEWRYRGGSSSVEVTPVEAWVRVRQVLIGGAPAVEAQELAAAVGVTRGTWYKWAQRAEDQIDTWLIEQGHLKPDETRERSRG